MRAVAGFLALSLGGCGLGDVLGFLGGNASLDVENDERSTSFVAHVDARLDDSGDPWGGEGGDAPDDGGDGGDVTGFGPSRSSFESGHDLDPGDHDHFANLSPGTWWVRVRWGDGHVASYEVHLDAWEHERLVARHSP